MKKDADIFIPIALDLDWPTAESVAECIKEQNVRYGFKNFFLACPGGGWRSGGYPGKEHFNKLASLFNEVKDRLSGEGITLGWWNTLTLKSGLNESFGRIVESSGAPHPFASCPLSEGFKKRFAQDVAYFAAKTKPAVIIFEDDYSISAAAGPLGCFCKDHLAEFSRREGREYTREELLAEFDKRDEGSLALQKRYRELMRDTMVELSEAVRREVDKESPEIPIGVMQSGGSDPDGDSVEAIARALAGERHVPFSRLYGAYYGGGDLKGIPKKAFHSIYSREHIGENFKFMSEADTFPHTRFFASAKQMKAFMGISYSSGFVGSTFQTQQLLDDPNEEEAYGRMFAAERKRFASLIDAATRCERTGVSLPYDPFYNTVDGGMKDSEPHWVRTLDLFGIPYTTRSASVTFLDERLAKYLSDREIKEYLSGGLFLDGSGARELCNRGYGEYIGVSVGENIAEKGYTRYDLGAREVIKPPFDSFSRGKNMPIAHMYAPKGNGKLLELIVNSDKTEVISEAYTFDKKFLTVAMSRFENSLGGRVVVMGMTVKGNMSQSLFNYRRMRLVDEQLAWCGADLPTVNGDPNVHLIFNRAKGEESFSHLLTAINLGDDTLPSLSLRLASDMKGKRILCLNESGEWQDADALVTETGVEVMRELPTCEPMYLLFADH